MRQRWLRTPEGGKVWQASKAKCPCSGYPFPRRKGSGACAYSSYAEFHAALRQGLSLAEAQQFLSQDALDTLYPLKQP